MSSHPQNRLYILTAGLFIFILALMPFHTFLTTWLGDLLGNDEPLKAVKDILIALLVILSALILREQPKVFKKLSSLRMNRLIAIYAVVQILVTLIAQPPAQAAVIGLAFNLRFLALFLVAQVLIATNSKPEVLRQRALKTVLIGGAVVASFGFLQATVLPDDFLTNFGYSNATVKPFLTVDNNPDFVRINSTLRGPNPLGAYMAVVMLIALAVWHKKPDWRRHILLAAPLALVTIYSTQSRSAWLALITGLGVFAVLSSSKHQHFKKWLLSAAAGLLVIIPSTYLLIKNTQFFQIQILHNDLNDNQTEDSNTVRLGFYEQAIEDIKENPLGDGAGTSGPASRYNDEGGRISESYYLQVAQEAGIIGLVLFIALSVSVAMRLWASDNPVIARGLIAGFAGVAVVNLFLHGWADDTTALIWWGVAGFYAKT